MQGRVLDENDKPVENARVNSGANITNTDINGVFRFDNIQIGKNAGSVSVEKDGYFKATRTMMTVAGAMQYAEIKLIPKTDRGNFASSAGGTISIENGSSVDFAANSILNSASNAAYTGSVHVLGAYLDPTSPLLSLTMPGNLTGLDSTKQLKQLQTFGMMAVELKGAAGEKLNLQTGKTATITLPIPAALLSKAPQTIPLWYFNDTTGLWTEQGFATKQNDKYVGTVSHFSFWNCDVPSNFVSLTMRLKDQDGHSLPYFRVKLTNTDNSSSAYGVTDTAGIVVGPVPANAGLQREIFSPCGKLLVSEQIGPFSTSTDIGTITVAVAAPMQTTISGSAINCLGLPVTNGYADILLDAVYHRAKINNGIFSVTINRCDTAASIASVSVTDADANKQSSTINLAITSGENNLDFVRVCDASTEQYINYTINDTMHVNFSRPADSFRTTRNSTTTNIYAYRKQGGLLNTSILFSGAASAGDYPLQRVNLMNGNLIVVLKDPGSVAVSEYGTSGGYITGGFSAVLRDSVGTNTYNAKVVFRVKRN